MHVLDEPHYSGVLPLLPLAGPVLLPHLQLTPLDQTDLSQESPGTFLPSAEGHMQIVLLFSYV